jgi:hypothetical protein
VIGPSLNGSKSLVEVFIFAVPEIAGEKEVGIAGKSGNAAGYQDIAD